MTIPEGMFRLHKRIQPPLEAGDWRLVAEQELGASGPAGTRGSSDLPVDRHEAHFRVRSPRYLLPPDQVLSTFPPANTSGSYGRRLPQVVIKRRTLPWERLVDPADRTVPWLALVLIAEGEARLDTNVPVAECVTAGVSLPGSPDVPVGNRLVVRRSVVHKVFPTRKDVPLLAHAREVDIGDTELMLGDDDGFLAVVISNRLPVPGRDEAGADTPVKYLACLVNLEGQLDVLLPESPPQPSFETELVRVTRTQVLSVTADDHLVMGTSPSSALQRLGPGLLGGPGAAEPNDGVAPPGGDTPFSVSHSTVQAAARTSGTLPPATRGSQWSAAREERSAADVYLEMARDFRLVTDAEVRGDPEYRFPVLLHWSFTTSGSTTFRSLMENLDSGLLGTAADTDSAPAGRLPLEVAESGHVGLQHRTREGDQVRAWFRGPLVAHPTTGADDERLPLAHAGDQLRIVIPDGREDLSLAAAFEVGRLLALSQPAIIGALLRWRQTQYQTARRRAAVEVSREFWRALLGAEVHLLTSAELGVLAGRRLVHAIVEDPGSFLGDPRPLVTPGRPLPFDGLASDLLATGLGFDPGVLRGDAERIYEQVRAAQVTETGFDPRQLPVTAVRDHLHHRLDRDLVGLAVDVVARQATFDPVVGPTVPPAEPGSGDGPRRFDEVLGDLDLDEQPDEQPEEEEDDPWSS